MNLRIVPITFRQACAFIDAHHRHHRPPQGMRFAIGVTAKHSLVGVATVGRPVARHLNDGATAEVTRVATDGTRNANSMLYAACWRAARAMGYRRLVTYTQSTETGASLRACGFLASTSLGALTTAGTGPAGTAAPRPAGSAGSAGRSAPARPAEPRSPPSTRRTEQARSTRSGPPPVSSRQYALRLGGARPAPRSAGPAMASDPRPGPGSSAALRSSNLGLVVRSRRRRSRRLPVRAEQVSGIAGGGRPSLATRSSSDWQRRKGRRPGTEPIRGRRPRNHRRRGRRDGGPRRVRRPHLHRRPARPHPVAAPPAPLGAAGPACARDRREVLRRRVRPDRPGAARPRHAHTNAFDIPIPRDGGIAELLAEAERADRRFVAVVCESIERVARVTYYGTKIEYRAGAGRRRATRRGRRHRPVAATRGENARQPPPGPYPPGQAGHLRVVCRDMLELSWDGFTVAHRTGFNIGKPPYGYTAAESRTPSRPSAPRARRRPT